MWRIIFIFSAVPIAAAMIARWWFGLRILSTRGKEPCSPNPDRWPANPDETPPKGAGAGTAADFGAQLRTRALAEWRTLEPKAASSRDNARRFGMAVPPLSGIVAVMAVVVAKIPAMGAISVLLAATALSCALGILSLAPELRAIARTAHSLRQMRAFPRRDDEDAVVECAIAHAWRETLPPIISLIQR